MTASHDTHQKPDRIGQAASGRFAFVAAALTLLASSIAVMAMGEGDWPMFLLGLGGLLVGRLVGVSERQLAVIALGLIAFAWPIALFTSPFPRATSTLAHIAIAALLAWVLADPVRHRWRRASAPPWTRRWFTVPLVVLGIGAVWEMGEWVGDAVLGTDLALRPLDSVADLVADFAGAVLGLAVRDRGDRGTLDGVAADSDRSLAAGSYPPEP